ncbi:kinetochore protein Nuf2 [Cricetulus griseus]|uniref:Kinetochore protein NUF2 n=1 Tax=Cricetulus griseus TaxID=10029 RepID=G3HQJ6_CRIGR|nr:kinetochore protein Nuf2 [Cricetulus griseus]XP_007644510.1 kinetochore protein Nuf2 [Cricetulus griseus]XP_007644511.1 kinetochore protein Nuf2 [Cricetulus griseus]XP_027272889.1 kinetochore protein Nuf2 [Cricetulus griseus]XP_027272890.1 kinetochore protein Nuf2 [Cricetulus griseus]XP_027272891.1 kinetochore protein Nuf2 [Cricetulus griseus]EGW06161.1 Kinetochore protein Nuf2 [Cricetulus griseus]ERE73205.1 kinetochore protein Nuf2-like protein [Cricetulus griseus]
METLSFPRYNVAEIVVHIRNKLLTGADGKNLSKNDLYPNPKPEVLYMIYMRALQIVYGVRLEHFYMMPVNAEVMYPHIMEGFLPVINLFFHLESFMPICRVNDFEITDIVYPKAKRTSRFLSGIINFIHFRESCRETYAEFLLQNKSPMDKMQQLNSAHQEALMKLEKLDSVPVEEQEEFKQLMDDIQELQHLLNQEFRQKTTVLQEGNAQKKSDISEKTKGLNELKLSVVSLKEVQDSLKSKIVDSPEKVKNYKEKMKNTVQKLRNSLQEVMEKYEIYRDSVDCLPSCQLEVQLYQNKIQDLADNREKLSNILKENLNLEDQIESDSSELKKLKTEENSLRRLMTVKKEKLGTTCFKMNKKREDWGQYKRTVIEGCNKVQEERGAVCEQVTTINQEIQKIKSGIQQLKDVVKKEKLKSQEIFVNLKSALEKYHERIEKTTEECCTKIEEKTAELKRRMFRECSAQAALQ